MTIQKSKRFLKTKFTEAVISRAQTIFLGDRTVVKGACYREIDFKGESWQFDSDAEFFSRYREDAVISALFTKRLREAEDSFGVNYGDFRGTDIRVGAEDRELIDKVFNIFEENAEACRIPEEDVESALRKKLRIFIGHGHDGAWRDVKDHLHEKHGFTIEAYETEPRAGLTITDVLKDAKRDAGFAILVMTGDNIDADGKRHARENVIHECGLFQGKLGFKRAIVLREEGCEDFSNLAGVQYIPFSKGRVQETFGEILAVIRREFLS